jgi:hypothetical protein
MDYSFNDRDLRVKKLVSDLKLDPLFWRRVLGKKRFFASYRIHPSPAVRPGVCRVIAAITRLKRFFMWDRGPTIIRTKTYAKFRSPNPQRLGNAGGSALDRVPCIP